MSARLTTKTVYQYEWDELVRNTRNAQAETKNAKNAIQTAQNQHKQEVKRIRRETERRQQSFGTTVRQLQGNFQQVAQRYEQALSQQNAAFNQQIQQQSETFNQQLNEPWQSAFGAMNELKRWTKANFEQQQSRIDGLRQDVNVLLSDRINNRQTAQEIINNAQMLFQSIANNKQISRFLTQASQSNPTFNINDIRSRLERAKGYLETNPTVAIANGDNLCFDLLKLHEVLEELHKTFEQQHLLTTTAMIALLEEIRGNRTQQLDNGEDGGYQAEIDFWTNGEFSKLEKIVEKLKNRLQIEKTIITSEEVEAVSQQLEVLQNRQNSLLNETIARVNASQLRGNMADAVVECLHREGFYKVSAGYEQDDPRNIYLVKVRNIAGDEIVALIAPDDEPNANTISLNTVSGAVLNEEENSERYEVLKKRLMEAGVSMSSFECRDDHVEGIYDVDSIVQSGSKGIPKRALKKAQLVNNQTMKK